MSGLDVTARWEEGGLCRIGLGGEARLDTVEGFDEVAAEAERRGVDRIVIDLSDLTFMDSASAGSLLRLRNRTVARGGKLAIFGLPRLIARLFQRLGFDETFAIEKDEETARARTA